MIGQKSSRRLESAYERERLDTLKRIKRYEKIMEKIMAFPLGEGSEPSTRELDQWREDLDALVKLKLSQA